LGNKGRVLSNIGNYTGAIEYYDKVLNINPNDLFALVDMGMVHQTLNNYTEAIKYYDRALVMEPNDVYTLVEKGKALSSVGNYSEAIDYYDRALQVDPNNTSISFIKNNTLSIMNNPGNQQDVDDLVSKGIDAAYLGNYSGALDYYDEALDINSNDTMALNMKAVTLYELGNYTGALYYYNKTQEVVGDERFRLSEIGDVLTALGNYSEALSHYEEALEFFPYDEVAIDGKTTILSIYNLINETKSRENSDSSISSNVTEKTKATDLRLGVHLQREAEGYPGFEGEYQLDEKVGVYAIFGSNKQADNIFKLQESTPNLIRLSDSQIGVDLAFSIPALPNSTLQSIERIKGLYDIKYIDTQLDYKKLIAVSDSPLTINNTQYTNLTIEVKNFNNNTGYLFIDGYE
jgi:tetratricopeptide (TPR) repeat protein